MNVARVSDVKLNRSTVLGLNISENMSFFSGSMSPNQSGKVFNIARLNLSYTNLCILIPRLYCFSANIPATDPEAATLDSTKCPVAQHHQIVCQL